VLFPSSHQSGNQARVVAGCMYIGPIDVAPDEPHAANALTMDRMDAGRQRAVAGNVENSVKKVESSVKVPSKRALLRQERGR